MRCSALRADLGSTVQYGHLARAAIARDSISALLSALAEDSTLASQYIYIVFCCMYHKGAAADDRDVQSTVPGRRSFGPLRFDLG